MPTQQTPLEIPVENLYNHPNYVVIFDSAQGIPPVSGSSIISLSEEYVLDMKKAIPMKLNDHNAKLTNGSCPSHHSPNHVIPLSNDNSCPWLGNINHLWSAS